jgi:MarR family transcriptional regulator for hemolysin
MAADLENDFLVLLYDVARHIRTHADQASRETGLTRAQWIILARLKREPGLSQNELAALAQVAPITVARLVDRLEALSLVERCTDQEDRRIWRLRLTPAAAPVLRDLKRYRAKLHDITTRGIDPAVLRTMRSGLRQMKENLTNSRRDAEASA